MSRLYSCLITLSAAIAVTAQELPARANATPCPGVNYADDTISACCVAGTIPPVFLSVCEGWPICQGPTTTTTTSTPLSCATLIPFSDANYLSELNSAKSSMAASGTTFCTTIGVAGNKCAQATSTTAEPKATAKKTGNSATQTSTQGNASSTTSSDGASGTASSGSQTSGSQSSPSGSQSTDTQSTGTQSSTASGATNTSGANALDQRLGSWALVSTAAMTAWLVHLSSSL